MKNISYNA